MARRHALASAQGFSHDAFYIYLIDSELGFAFAICFTKVLPMYGTDETKQIGRPSAKIKQNCFSFYFSECTSSLTKAKLFLWASKMAATDILDLQNVNNFRTD